MKLSVQQPGYLPDPLFFSKMSYSDILVLGDTLQYSTRASLNRTRIKTARGAKWLTVPVLSKGRTGQLVKHVELDSTVDWRRSHRRTLEINYNATPYYGLYIDVLDEALAKSWSSLFELNRYCISILSAELGIGTSMRLLSEFDVLTSRTQKVMGLLAQLNCDTYVAFDHEATLIDRNVLRDAGFALETLAVSSEQYHQRFGPFVPGLSIIDLLMNEGPDSLEIITKNMKYTRH